MDEFITIPKTEYEQLIRESERCLVLERLAKSDNCFLKSDIKAILNIKNKQENKNETL